jgi:acetyl/propionyl-CoA carboxylase alpha subunit
MTPRAPYRPFRSVLVANRGEIALRVIRGLREAGITSIAVTSEPDRYAPHALAADRCVVIGEGPAASSYLDMHRVLAAADALKAEAIHPGYGFLAENAEFARRTLSHGLVWIGPPPEVMTALGDKIAAKRLARSIGVPTAASYEGDTSDVAAVEREALRIGLPVLVKAAAGGGGRGMRVVRERANLREALESAAREAGAAFGDGRVFLERLVSPARHVEIQILADAAGEVVHLGERECSVQRRHQKVVEWSPSTAVDAALRRRMGEAAVALARAAGYVGAGTVEFLLGEDGSFHFLEVNTRLQVEHPVTEMVTGLDLVDLQLRTAAGGALPPQGEIPALRGHAIELRICAEDPARDFAPQAGRVLHAEFPHGPGVRVDAGIRTGSDVPPHYDSLIAKLIVHAPARPAAVERALRALDDVVILGPTTNVDFLRAVLGDPAVRSGDVSTSFLEERFAARAPAAPPPEAAFIAAAVGELLAGSPAPSRDSARGDRKHDAESPWRSLGDWRAVESA